METFQDEKCFYPHDLPDDEDLTDDNTEEETDSLLTLECEGYDLIECLKVAIEKKSVCELNFLLGKLLTWKTNKKYFKQESFSLLCCAIMNDAVTVIPYLIQAGARRFDSDGDTDILLAIQHKRTNVLKSLLNFKKNINTKNKKGYFPLFLAAELDMVEEMKLLLKAGAKVDMKIGPSVKLLNENYFKQHMRPVLGDTIAHLLVRRIAMCDASEMFGKEFYDKYCLMLNMILDAKFCMSVTNSKGHSLLDEVILNKIKSADILKRLVQEKFPIKLAKPFHLACRMHPDVSVLVLEAIKDQTVNTVDMVNASCGASYPPLFVACGQLNVPAVEWLLQNGADANSVTSSQVNAREYYDDLQCGMDYAQMQSTLLTPMHIAASWVRLKMEPLSDVHNILRLLIKHGARVDAMNSALVTPLCCALRAISNHVYKFTKGTDENLIYKLISVLLLLLQAGADPDKCFNWNAEAEFMPYIKLTRPSRHILERFPNMEQKPNRIIMLILEMSTSMAKKARTTVKEINHRLRHLSDFVPERMIDRCLRQPRSLMVQSRKVILECSNGRHLFDRQKYLHMLPERLQDYLCMTYLLDPQWYIDQA